MILLLQPLSIASLLVLSGIGVLLYRLSLHPLAKYPGPFLSKVTDWHEFAAVKTGDHHIWLYQMHEKYGPVVRVAPNRLSYNTTDALRSIYADRKANIRKSGFTEMISTLTGGRRNLQTINDRPTYNVRRRLIAHAFSEEALHSSEGFILGAIRRWCQLLNAKAVKPGEWTTDVDMKTWAELLTEDILGELCFGESFGALERGISDSGDLAVEGCKQAQALAWMPLPNFVYDMIRRVANYGTRQEWAALKPQIDYQKRIQSMMDRRLAMTGSTRKDMFHYISQAKDAETGETITELDMRAEAGVLFGAGMDTSATCIAACIYYLLKYPETLAKLNAEIRGAFNGVEEIVQGPTLSGLDYLRACIDETLRFTPPAPGPMLRIVTAGGLTVDGDIVPPGAEVAVPAYAIHHNEMYFPKSWTFNPDRWMPETLAATRDAFCPFTLGPRVCIGRQLAYLDMTLALARLLFSFDIRLSERDTLPANANGQVEYKIQDWFITERHGPLVQLRPRI